MTISFVINKIEDFLVVEKKKLNLFVRENVSNTNGLKFFIVNKKSSMIRKLGLFVVNK
jgi:hypothetical protein